MRYRKKPVIVEAVQWFALGDHPKVIKAWEEEVAEDVWNICLCEIPGIEPITVIKTLEGWMTVSAGDWIVTGIQGEVYPVKDEIFRSTYELMEKEE